MKTSILHIYQSDPPGKPRKTGFARQIAAIVLLLQWCLTGMANVYNVNTTADGTSSVGTVHLRGAIAAADAAGGTHTINVPAGTYELTLGQISFGNNAQDITITGAGPAATIIRQTTASRIFLINPPGTVASVVTRISGIRFTNGDVNDDNFGGGAILCGGRTNSTTISNCAFENNRVNPGSTNAGGAIRSNGGGTLSISQSSFTGNSVPNASGSGGAVQYQLTAYSIGGVPQNPNGNLTITGSTFNNNTVGSNGSGGAITVQAAAGISGQTLSVNIARNTFTNNNGGSRGGAIHTINSFGTGAANTWNINFNRFVGNQASSGNALQLDDVQGSVDATNNWWGCNSGPAGCSDNAVRGAGNSSGQLIATPYLQLRTIADASSVCGANATSAFRAGFTTNSAGQTISTGNLTALENLPISFVATLGTISSASSSISNSTASGIYNAGSSPGTGTINAVVDNVPANDAVARASVTINAAPVITSQPAGTFVCSGSRSTVALSVTATGSSLSYQWYRGATLLTNGATGTGSTISGATTSTLTISNAGSADAASDYRVQVTAGASCAVTSNNAGIVSNPSPNIFDEPDDVNICAGNQAIFGVSLSISGNPTFRWFKGSTQLTDGATGNGSSISGTGTNILRISNVTLADNASNYYMTITSSNGCADTTRNAALVVNPGPAKPVITASGPTSFCSANGRVTLTAPTGFASYAWSNGATTPSITVTQSGSYSVTVSNGSCSSVASDAVSVTAIPSPNIFDEPDDVNICAGNQAVFGVSLSISGNPTFRWFKGSTQLTDGATGNGSSISGTGTNILRISNVTLADNASNYYMTITSSNGCADTTRNTTLVVNPGPAKPVITASGPITFCAGGRVTLTAPAGFASYTWSNGATTSSITVTQSGSYSVTVSNGTCSSVASDAVIVDANVVPEQPVVTVGGPTTFCAGGSVTLTAPAGFTYLWSNGATTQSITVTQSGSYSVAVTNNSGCTSPSSNPVSVTVNPLPARPSIALNGPTTFCAGGSVTLTAPAGFTYLWSTGATTQSITVNQTGAYTVTITNSNGCSIVSLPTTVTVNPLPAKPVIAVGGPTTFCAGGSVTLTAPAGFTYLWSTGATTQSITVSQTGTYTVTVTNNNGCTSPVSDAINVTVNPLPARPSIALNGPTTFCAGGNVTLTAPAGFTYLWSTGATTQSITVSQTGAYTVTITNSNGCSIVSLPTTVTVNPIPAKPVIAVGGPTTFCAGGSVTLTAPAGFTYLWSTGATTQSITVSQTGTYTVTVTNNNGCTSPVSDAVNVTVNPLPAKPTVIASGPTIFNEGDSVILTAPAGFAYLWSTGATTQSIVVYTAGAYTVAVTNSNGCTSAPSDPVVVNLYVDPVIFVTVTGAGNRSGLNWANAISNGQIQSKMSSVVRKSQFWVKTGTYYPTDHPDGCSNCNSDRDRAFLLRNNVGLYGGFAGTEFLLSQRNVAANPTVFSGDVGTPGNNGDNSYHVVISISNDSSARLDGFTVTGGNANGYGERYFMYVNGAGLNQSSGAGIYNLRSAPFIANTTIEANSSSSSGAGIYNIAASPIVAFSTVASNSSSYNGGGMASRSSSAPVVTNTQFRSNYAAGEGGGIFNEYSTLNITNSSFVTNSSYSGGGIANYGATATITNTAFAANTANNGGGVYNIYTSSVAITNSVFASNTAGSGGAVYNSSASPVIVNSTFYTNATSNNGSNFYNSNANPTITNSIIWSSNGAGISNQSSSPSITYSIVKGGYPGTGNLDADPLFVNAGNPAGADGVWGTADDGLKLQATSPAINAGNNAAVPAGITTDITGAARIQGGIVDLGAYEEALSVARTNGAGKSDAVAKTRPGTAESKEVILTAFPVPAKDMIWVKTNATASTGNNLVIMDARGRIIQSVRISTWPQRIDISTLAPGTYFIKADAGKAIAFTKQ